MSWDEFAQDWLGAGLAIVGLRVLSIVVSAILAVHGLLYPNGALSLMLSAGTLGLVICDAVAVRLGVSSVGYLLAVPLLVAFWLSPWSRVAEELLENYQGMTIGLVEECQGLLLEGKDCIATAD